MAKRKKKIEVSKKSNDEIREIILSFFYSIHKKARSLKGSRLKISKVKIELKKLGLTEKEIASNLAYLIQTEWIREEKDSYQLRTAKGVIPVEKKYYRISNKGIDHFEGISKFQKTHKISGINITNIQGVTIIGDENIVNAQYSNLYRNLDLLAEEIRRSDKFSDEEKLNYQAEIGTIKSQLSKPTPDKSIVKKAWNKLEALATISGVVNFFLKVKELIGPLLR